MSYNHLDTESHSFKHWAATLFFLIVGWTHEARAEILWGVNGHPIRGAVFADADRQFEIMKQNHLTTYRMDIALTSDNEARAIARTRELVASAKKHNILLRPVLLVPFHWDDRTDGGRYPAGDAEALYRQGFDRVYNFVRLFKDDITDWELDNEVNLLVKDWRGKPLFGRGWSAEEFDTPLMNDWSAVFRGMSDALRKINAQYGAHLKCVFGTTSTHFGYLDYMQKAGVAYDVLGYHNYMKLEENPYQAWSKATPPFNLFQKLGSYGKPVRFTEINAAEIYEKGYKNNGDDPLTQQGYRSLDKVLGLLCRQKDMVLEEVDIYEILDDPNQKEAEGRFGLLYDLNRPKKALSIVQTTAKECR